MKPLNNNPFMESVSKERQKAIEEIQAFIECDAKFAELEIISPNTSLQANVDRYRRVLRHLRVPYDAIEVKRCKGKIIACKLKKMQNKENE